MTPDLSVYRCPVSGLYLDPLAVQRKLLLLSKGEINPWLQDHLDGDEAKSLAAEEKLLPVVREAMKLSPIDPRTGEGVTDEACLRALNFYLGWMQEKKVRGQSLLTGSPCSDCPQK